MSKTQTQFIKSNKVRAIAVAATAIVGLGALLSGCSSNSDSASGSASSLSGTLAGGGSSAQTAAQEAWRSKFQTSNPNVTVTYDPTGSGTGRTNFTNGGYAFSGTDDAFKTDAAKGPFAPCADGASLVEVPAYVSPIAVAFKLDGVDNLNLSSENIAKIFTGQITTWNDPAIKADNSSANLPSTKITVVHRSDKSGTTDNFTDYLSKTAGSVWTYGNVETWPANLQGEAAEKTQGVQSTLSSTNGAIGYIDLSQSKGLGIAKIKVGSDWVAPSASGAATTLSKSPQDTEGRSATDVVVKVDRTLNSDKAYPLILVSYLTGCTEYKDAAQGKLAAAFISYAVSADGQKAAASNAGSAPLPATGSLADNIKAAVAKIK